MNHPPSHYEDIAIDAQRRGDWKRAILAWNSAAAASIGHNRSYRYRNAAWCLADKHGFPAGGYLTDLDRGKDHVTYGLMIVAEQLEWDEVIRYRSQAWDYGIGMAGIVREGIEEMLDAGEDVDEVLPYHYLGTPAQAEGG